MPVGLFCGRRLSRRCVHVTAYESLLVELVGPVPLRRARCRHGIAIAPYDVTPVFVHARGLTRTGTACRQGPREGAREASCSGIRLGLERLLGDKDSSVRLVGQVY